ncbi:hypothetical protein FRC11_015075, partial [Ceratobasidium sp. 423]
MSPWESRTSASSCLLAYLTLESIIVHHKIPPALARLRYTGALRTRARETHARDP